MILVIPDYYDRFYVRELVNVLLVQMGFGQLCIQQVRLPTLPISPAATYLHV